MDPNSIRNAFQWEYFHQGYENHVKKIRDFDKSYVDDIAVYSDDFSIQLTYIDQFLMTMRSHGITLGLNKTELIKPRIKLVGFIIGSGERSVGARVYRKIYITSSLTYYCLPQGRGQ